MKLKQNGLKLGLTLVAAGLMAAQAHAADGALEPLELGAALPLAGEVQVAALEQVGSATPLPVAAAAASGGPLGVEGSAALAAFSAADIATLFEPSAAPLQLAALSEQEMKETDGAWGPWGAFIGGVGGFSGFALNNRISGSRWSTTGAIAATFTGARLGATAGPVGVIWGFNASIGGGTALGVTQRFGW